LAFDSRLFQRSILRVTHRSALLAEKNPVYLPLGIASYESALIRPEWYSILTVAMAAQTAPAATRSGKSSERQWPRFKVDFSVKLLIGSHGTKSSVPGRAHDLGQGGVALYAVAELEEGQQLQVEFTPPFSRRPLLLTAIVRDRAGYRYGLEFRKLTRDASDDLSRACRALSLSTE
jgi:hypothetical protein